MSERKEAWFRIIVLVVTGVVLGVWSYLVCVLAIVHWLVVVFTGKRVKGIAEFLEYWNTESYKFYRYISGVSNQRPFPFSEMQRMGKFK